MSLLEDDWKKRSLPPVWLFIKCLICGHKMIRLAQLEDCNLAQNLPAAQLARRVLSVCAVWAQTEQNNKLWRQRDSRDSLLSGIVPWRGHINIWKGKPRKIHSLGFFIYLLTLLFAIRTHVYLYQTECCKMKIWINISRRAEALLWPAVQHI